MALSFECSWLFSLIEEGGSPLFRLYSWTQPESDCGNCWSRFCTLDSGVPRRVEGGGRARVGADALGRCRYHENCREPGVYVTG